MAGSGEAKVRADEAAPGDFGGPRVHQLIDGGIHRVGDALQELGEAHRVEMAAHVWNELEGRERSPPIDSNDLLFNLVENHVIGGISGLNPHDLARLNVHRHNVGLGVSVAVQVLQAVLLNEHAGRFGVFPHDRQGYVLEVARAALGVYLIRVDVIILSDARAFKD